MTTRLGLGPSILLAPATATWAAPFAAYYLFLQARVIQQRIKNEKGLGNSTDVKDGNDPLSIASRCQANFVENVPIALTVSLLAELNGADRRTLMYGLGALFAARVAHVEFGMLAEGADGPGRKFGFLGTSAFIASLSGYLAYLVKDYWLPV